MTSLSRITVDLPGPPDDADTATAVTHWHRLVGQCGMATLEAAARAGEALAEQRDILQQQRRQGGSGWREWLNDLPVSSRQCYRYMQIAQRWGEVVTAVAQLPDDEVSVRAALKLLTADAKAARESEARETRSREAAKIVGDCGIVTGDFRTADIQDESVDLIFTDPPYLEGDINIYRDLSAFADRVLRPGGLCLAYAGNFAVPRIIEGLGSHLEYVWTFSITHSGGDARFRKWRLFNTWKPIFAFGKPPVKAWWEWFQDSMPRGKKEKALHPWQQSEAEAAYYIKNLSSPGGIVCDPCCGSGTSLAAAKSLGRRYIGFEIDPDTAATARARLAADVDADAA